MSVPEPGTLSSVPTSPSSEAIPLSGYLCVVMAALLWAVSGSSAKFLFQQGITPPELVQLRATLSVPCLLAWLVVFDRRLLRIERRDILYFAILGVAGMAMVQITYFYAISKIQVAVAILLEYLAPAFIAIYAVVFARERLTRASLMAIIGSTAGCYLAVGAYNMDLLAMNALGIAMGVLSGVAFALSSIMGERGMRRYDPRTVLFYTTLFAALFWNVAHPPFKAFVKPDSWVEWGWVCYIAFLGTALPYALYFQGINTIRATRASVTAMLEPISAAFIAYIFLGEHFEPLQLMGGGVVIASVVLLQVSKERDANTPALIRARRKRCA